MRHTLRCQITTKLSSERGVGKHTITDVRDEVESVAEIALDLFSLGVLLAGAVNLVQQRAYMAGGSADVLLFLSLDIQDVLTRADAQRVAHDIYRRVRGDRRLRQPAERIDKNRAVEGHFFVLERLHEALACAIGPARVVHAAEHRGPACAVWSQPIGCRAARTVSVAVDLGGRG